MKWYVVYTRSRFEKKVESTLLERNFEAYCPKITRRKKWSDRYKNVAEPLFKSYVFVKIDPKQKYEVLEDAGIVKFVNFKGQSPCRPAPFSPALLIVIFSLKYSLTV